VKVKKKNSMGLSVYDFFTLLAKGGEGGGVSTPCSAHLEPSQGHRSLLRQHTRLLLRHLLCGMQYVPDHREGRVLSFFSSRRNWDSPNPSPEGRVFPPPPWFRGEEHTRLRERGWVVPIPTRGQTLWYSRYICTLCSRCSTTKENITHRKRSKILSVVKIICYSNS
jgi:hypothetical protein